MTQPWKPQYFAKTTQSLAKQVLPPKVYKGRGTKGLELMNQDLLMTLDDLRKNLEVPLIVNDESWGRTQSGLRDEDHYGSVQSYLNSKSQHKYGNALDFVSPCLSSQEIRKHIIENKVLYPSISFLEVGKLKEERDMSWCHIDCRMRMSSQQIVYWSPLYGFVDEERVLLENL